MKEKMKSAFTTNDQNDVRQNETIIDFENSEKQAQNFMPANNAANEAELQKPEKKKKRKQSSQSKSPEKPKKNTIE